MQILRRLQEHTGGRFAAGAGNFVFRAFAGKALFGMVRTKIDGVQIGALFAQQGFQTVMHGAQLRLRAHPLGDDRLIGDKDSQISLAVQRCNGFCGAGEKLDLLRLCMCSL